MSDTGGGATREAMLSLLPLPLAQDETGAALAALVAGEMDEAGGELDRLGIFCRVDELEEALLDILAEDLKVDWYDGDYTVEQKRQTVKDSLRVHKVLGSRAAVETAVRAIFPESEVVEWWKYGGKPYHFRLLIDAEAQQVDEEHRRKVLERVDCYKPLRSVLDEVEYRDAGASAEAEVVAVCAGCQLTDAAVAVRY